MLELGRVPWNPIPSLGEPVPAACDAALTWAECSGTRFPVWGNRFLLCVFGSELGQSALEPGSQFGGTGSCYVLLVRDLGRMHWNPVPSLGEPVPVCVFVLEPGFPYRGTGSLTCFWPFSFLISFLRNFLLIALFYMFLISLESLRSVLSS